MKNRLLTTMTARQCRRKLEKTFPSTLFCDKTKLLLHDAAVFLCGSRNQLLPGKDDYQKLIIILVGGMALFWPSVNLQLSSHPPSSATTVKSSGSVFHHKPVSVCAVGKPWTVRASTPLPTLWGSEFTENAPINCCISIRATAAKGLSHPLLACSWWSDSFRWLDELYWLQRRNSRGNPSGKEAKWCLW